MGEVHVAREDGVHGSTRAWCRRRLISRSFSIIATMGDGGGLGRWEGMGVGGGCRACSYC